jgi:quercetin dioxygenase-like cupin family protein
MILLSCFQIEKDIPWQEADQKIERQVYGYNDEIMMVKVKFEKGGIGDMHQHPHTQVTYVESGQFELTIGNNKRILNKGDGFFVPPDVPHGCVCLESGMLIDCFTPMRADFV